MAELIVCEAQPEDAKSLTHLLQQVEAETDFIIRDVNDAFLTVVEMETFLAQQLSSLVQICLVAKLANQVVGVLNIVAKTSSQSTGDLFIAVAKEYRGYGVGQLLMEAALDWAEHTPEISQITLTVQVRNKRAIHIYEKFGFEIEATQKRGAKTKDGEFLDVYLMGKRID